MMIFQIMNMRLHFFGLDLIVELPFLLGVTVYMHFLKCAALS